MNKLLSLLIAAFFIGQAWGACHYYFDDSLQSSYSLNYSSPLLVNFYVSTNKRDCDHFIGVSSPSLSYRRRLVHEGGTSYSIPFQLYQSNHNSILKDYPDGSWSNYLTPNYLDKEMEHSFRAYLGYYSSFAPAGRYSERFLFSLYSGSMYSSYNSLETSRWVEFTYDIPQQIAISLVPSGAPFDYYNHALVLDFGTLQVGSSLSFDIVVLSNSGMELTLSSLNDGRLLSYTNNGYVDYQVSIDGGGPQSLRGSLGNPLMVKRESGVLPWQGRRVHAQVDITSLSKAQSGYYSDYVMITAATVY